MNETSLAELSTQISYKTSVLCYERVPFHFVSQTKAAFANRDCRNTGPISLPICDLSVSTSLTAIF